MPDDRTDIVMTTRNRLPCLKQTLEYLFERTRSPYVLHVVDDASDEGNVEYLLELWRLGKIESLLLRNERHGLVPNLNAGAALTHSDPFVSTDDDVLCPDVEPDWLARGLAAMKRRPKLAVLALNHPGAHRPNQERDREVVYCKWVGGTFAFLRRELACGCPLPHHRRDFGGTPTILRCEKAYEQGWRVGFLLDTFCHHIGEVSMVHPGDKYHGKLIEPLDWKTFRAAEEYLRT